MTACDVTRNRDLAYKISSVRRLFSCYAEVFQPATRRRSDCSLCVHSSPLSHSSSGVHVMEALPNHHPAVLCPIRFSGAPEPPCLCVRVWTRRIHVRMQASAACPPLGSRVSHPSWAPLPPSGGSTFPFSLLQLVSWRTSTFS